MENPTEVGRPERPVGERHPRRIALYQRERRAPACLLDKTSIIGRERSRPTTGIPACMERERDLPGSHTQLEHRAAPAELRREQLDHGPLGLRRAPAGGVVVLSRTVERDGGWFRARSITRRTGATGAGDRTPTTRRGTPARPGVRDRRTGDEPGRSPVTACADRARCRPRPAVLPVARCGEEAIHREAYACPRTTGRQSRLPRPQARHRPSRATRIVGPQSHRERKIARLDQEPSPAPPDTGPM